MENVIIDSGADHPWTPKPLRETTLGNTRSKNITLQTSVFNHGFVLHILELRASRLNNCTIGSTIFTFIHIALSTKYFFPFSIKRVLIKYSIVCNLAFLLHFPVDRSGNLDLSRFCSLSIRILWEFLYKPFCGHKFSFSWLQI